MFSRSRTAVALAAMAVFCAGGLLGAAPATAEPGASVCRSLTAIQDLNIRSQPSTTSSVVGTLKKGSLVCMLPVSGSTYTACKKTSKVWIAVPVPSSKAYGYAAAACLTPN
ncbi:SH3 domain-containing protein [Streptomyces xiamenensis]|uniref:SH3 domain-containing protein n=1 Tax=Streptomyces xiamenensis TaxID=408015 RepID=UPI0035D7ED0B